MSDCSSVGTYVLSSDSLKSIIGNMCIGCAERLCAALQSPSIPKINAQEEHSENHTEECSPEHDSFRTELTDIFQRVKNLFEKYDDTPSTISDLLTVLNFGNISSKQVIGNDTLLGTRNAYTSTSDLAGTMLHEQKSEKKSLKKGKSGIKPPRIYAELDLCEPSKVTEKNATSNSPKTHFEKQYAPRSKKSDIRSRSLIPRRTNDPKNITKAENKSKRVLKSCHVNKSNPASGNSSNHSIHSDASYFFPSPMFY